jgi:hypothetical protein
LVREVEVQFDLFFGMDPSWDQQLDPLGIQGTAGKGFLDYFLRINAKTHPHIDVDTDCLSLFFHGDLTD